MEKYHLYFLVVHIAAGIVSLVMAPIAFLVLKGGPAHRRWGKVYFYAMAVVALTAVIMSVYHHILFLLLIAVFSFANAARGYRSVYRKKPGQANYLDWGIDLLNAAFCLGLIVYAFMVSQIGNNTIAIVAGAFGVFGLQSSVRQLWRLKNPPADKKAWLYEHIGNMSGSYIAAVTAFLVNTTHFLPTLFNWLGPTLIGVPLIYYTLAKYKRKYAKGEKVALVERES